MLLLENRTIRFNTNDEWDLKYYKEHKEDFLNKGYTIDENNPYEFKVIIGYREEGEFDVLNERSWRGEE